MTIATTMEDGCPLGAPLDWPELQLGLRAHSGHLQLSGESGVWFFLYDHSRRLPHRKGGTLPDGRRRGWHGGTSGSSRRAGIGDLDVVGSPRMLHHPILADAARPRSAPEEDVQESELPRWRRRAGTAVDSEVDQSGRGRRASPCRGPGDCAGLWGAGSWEGRGACGGGRAGGPPRRAVQVGGGRERPER